MRPARPVAAIALVVALAAITGCAQARPPLTVASSEAPAASSQIPVPTQSGSASSPSATATATASAPSSPPSSVPDADIDDPSSDAVVVDKLRPLNPADYVPTLVTLDVPYANQNAYQLRPEASDALTTMFAAYTAQTGLKMQSQSAYRSYTAQKVIYNRYVAQNGRAWADRGSARPGFSEHQTGLALDINALPSQCPIQDCFKNTTAGKWLAKNSWKYGFILRYPDGYEKVTGYKYEPWHYRYIGVDLAAQYHASGATTLEGFFGLAAAPDYAGG